MTSDADRSRMTPKLIDSLYVEAMLLADEARGYFDQQGREERAGLAPMSRVGFSCESLKVTTRLMHIIAWLLTQRAAEAGELAERPGRRLGKAAASDSDAIAGLPATAINLIRASGELYARVERLDQGNRSADAQPSPARSLMSRLERSL